MPDDDESRFVPVPGSKAEPTYTAAAAYGSPIPVGATEADDVSTFVGSAPRLAAAVPVPAESDDASTLLAGAAPRLAAAVPVPAESDDASTLLVGAAPRLAAAAPAAGDSSGAGTANQEHSVLPEAEQKQVQNSPVEQKKVPRMPSLSPYGSPAAQDAAAGSVPLIPVSVQLKRQVAERNQIGYAEVNYLPDGTLLDHGKYRVILEEKEIILWDNGERSAQRVKMPLGQGGFGITYLADEIDLDRRVVIKELFPRDYAVRLRNLSVEFPMLNQLEDPYELLRENFLKEAKVIAAIEERHANIVGIITYFRENNTSYYVMPYMEGASLRACMGERNWDEASARELLQGLLSGLAYLHELGILHLDIKPDNVLMHGRTVPVLIDFGAARSTIITNDALVVSVGYAPPEQCSYETINLLGPWSDLYALGATMYHVITGARPRAGIRPLLEQAQSYPRYSRAFLASVDKAMHPEIKHRWQSAREWLELFSRMDEITHDAKRLI